MVGRCWLWLAYLLVFKVTVGITCNACFWINLSITIISLRLCNDEPRPNKPKICNHHKSSLISFIWKTIIAQLIGIISIRSIKTSTFMKKLYIMLWNWDVIWIYKGLLSLCSILPTTYLETWTTERDVIRSLENLSPLGLCSSMTTSKRE